VVQIFIGSVKPDIELGFGKNNNMGIDERIITDQRIYIESIEVKDNRNPELDDNQIKGRYVSEDLDIVER
jgi:hypothetical protein